jgi:hypothetical protein
MSHEVDWKYAVEKICGLFEERCRAIRREVDADQILASAMRTLLSATDENGHRMDLDDLRGSGLPVSLDARFLKDSLDQINEAHREKIVGLAESIGTVVRQYDPHVEQINCRMVGEEEGHVLVGTSNILIRIEKDKALKILALGDLP